MLDLVLWLIDVCVYTYTVTFQVFPGQGSRSFWHTILSGVITLWLSALELTQKCKGFHDRVRGDKLGEDHSCHAAVRVSLIKCWPGKPKRIDASNLVLHSAPSSTGHVRSPTASSMSFLTNPEHSQF